MATELGQAYVQIMPSAKGISGSIQKALGPEAISAGKSAGSNIASSISKSLGSMGKSLTKSITLPVAGATTAVAGLVGTLGFKRLIGLDTAQAKLKGLGYEGKDVDRIMKQVKNATKTGMTTVGEGADVAAGALASGVKEGAELEKYIKLVGDAAVGSNRPVDEMAMIFNRVQGGGKLMTQELNSIEQGMPGFSRAMADSLGVPQDEFAKMVTAGKVSSSQFLDVMDDFAGGMAEAYGESFAGMWDNVKAYTGMIGEALIGGLFEDGKKGLAEFIEVLQSDAVMEWAAETGEKIREVVNNLVDAVKDAIKWWMDLDEGTKTLIGTLAGIMVVAGPIMLAISKIITTIMSLVPLFKTIGVVIGAITSPVGLAVAAIIGAAALIYIYWEPIKQFFIDLWEAIKESAIAIWDVLKDWWSNSVEFFKNLWEAIPEFFTGLWESVMTAFQFVWDTIIEYVDEKLFGIEETFNDYLGAIVLIISEAWEFLYDIWSSALEFILGDSMENFTELKSFFDNIMGGIWEIVENAWVFISDTFSNAVGFIMALVRLDFGVMKQFILQQMDAISLFIGNVWNAIKTIFSNLLSLIVGVVKEKFNQMVNSINVTLSQIRGFIQTVWNSIKSIISSVMSSISSIISSIWNAIRGIISSVMSGISSIISSIWNAIMSIISSVMSGISSVISSVWNSILSIISSITSSISSVVSSIFNGLGGIVRGAMGNVLSAISSGMGNALSTVTGFITSFFNAGKNIVGAIADGIRGAIGKVTGAISDVASKIRDFLPFSPPKTGPLIDIMDVKWGETIAGGINKGEGTVEKAMDELLNFDLTKKAKFHNPNGTSNNDDDQDDSQQKRPIIMQVDGKTFAKITGDYYSEEGGNRIRKFERGLA